MKKLIVAIIFIFFILVFPQRVLYAQVTSYAPTSVISGPTTDPFLTPTPTEIEYQLPYPGILPDNPLYSLKVARDRIVGFFIADPLKKAEFDLLQADKRLNSGIYLVKKKAKDELISSTISKGENYFEEALNKTQEAKKQGEDVNEFVGQLITASQKHQEVLKQLELHASGSLLANLTADQKRVEGFEKGAKSYLKK